MYLIGDIFKPFGIKGYLKVKPLFEKPNLVFKKGIEVFVNNNSYEIEDVKAHQDFYLVKLKGLDSINDILEIDKNYMHVKKSNLASEKFLVDLINFNIIFNNKNVGTVSSVVYKPTELLKINNKFFLPFVDDFIEKIDYNNKEIYVKRMDELN